MEMTAGTISRVEEAKARARAVHGDTYVGGMAWSEDGRYPLGVVLIATHGLQQGQAIMRRYFTAWRHGHGWIYSAAEAQTWLAEFGA